MVISKFIENANKYIGWILELNEEETKKNGFELKAKARTKNEAKLILKDMTSKGLCVSL